MTKDSKVLRKMFLLNESSFQKIKDIDDTERNFDALDKAMRAILYNKKLNTHEKLIKYTDLLEKYLKLRKQLVAKYGENSVKTSLSTQQSNKKEKSVNPFDAVNITNFPRLSTLFQTETTVNPENFKFNNTMPLENNENQLNDVSMFDLQSQMQPLTEEYFNTSGEFGDDVQLPPISSSAAARDSSIGNNTIIEINSLNDKIKVMWKGLPYTINKRFVKHFNEFTKKIQAKYPFAKSFALSDFVNYVVNKRVSIKSVEEKKLQPPVQRLDRKRKSTVQSTEEAKKKKSSKIDEFYQERKKHNYVLQPSKLDHQLGRGMKPKKWITLR